MKSKLSKILSLLLAIVILTFASPSVGALSQREQSFELAQLQTFAAPQTSTGSILNDMQTSVGVNVTTFKNYLFNQFKNNASSIDISQFNISPTQRNFDLICDFVFYNMPEAFHVNQLDVNYNSYELTILKPRYLTNSSNFQAMYKKMDANATKLLKGIQGNNSLTDVQKALLLHDRLAAWNEYDVIGLNKNQLSMLYEHSAYGALVDQSSVCDGYAKAYIYLLNRVGVKVEYVSSDALWHAWNLVYISGIPFHVDVTWDDGYIEGEVLHDNFLRSSNGIWSTGHEAYDYNKSPTNTTFDSNQIWENCVAEYQLFNNKIYYIEENGGNYILKDWNNTAYLNLNYEWPAGGSNVWDGHYGRLSSNSVELLISLGNRVYSYDPVSRTTNVVYVPNSVGGLYQIYGFTYRDGYLICNIANTANYVDLDSTTNHKLYTTEKLYYGPYGTGFSDVSKSGWYYDAVKFVTENGYFTGYSNSNAFGTSDNIQRQDFVLALARMEGVNLSQYSGYTSFADVPKNAYYTAAVNWASQNNIVTGYSHNNKFGVGDKITREQLVTIMYRYIKNYKHQNVTPSNYSAISYPDYLSVSTFAKDAVIWAISKGVIAGKQGKIAPVANAQRCEVAQIIYNCFQSGILQ